MIRVLVVDDKQENLYLLRALLEGHGCVVDEARHGVEALTRARETPPHLIISDLLMPVMDGYTLLRQWKADEQLRTIPFVVYTATYTEPKDERLALDLGADSFIIKPVEPEPFMARIHEVLAKKVRGELPPSGAPKGNEVGLLKEYSEVLVNKLEAKLFQLEQANHALQEEIARRKLVEAELLEARQDWEDIFQSIGHPTIIMDLNHAIVAANKKCIQVTGKSVDELLNAKCYEVFHKNGKRPHGCPMEALVKAGSTETVEMEMEALGGYYLVSCTPVLDEEGKIQKIIHIATDISERKRAEDAVRSEKDFSDTIMESLPGVFYLFRNDGKYLRWNKRLETITGYSYQEIDKMNSLDFFSEKNQPVIEEAITQALDQGEVIVEADILTKDGNEIPYLFTGNQVMLNESQCVVGMGIDIRERKRLEDEIKFNNILLSTQQEVSIDGILVVDEDGKILSLNSRFVNMWDIAPEVIERKTDELALHSVLGKLKYPEEFLKKVNYLYDHRDKTTRDEIALKDGRTFDRYSAPMMGTDGAYYGRVWYFRDVTSRKQAEEALKESEQRYRTLFEESIDGVYSVLRDGEITDANASFCQLFGYTREEMIGRDIHELYVDPADRPKFQEEIEKEGFVKDYEVKLRTRAGIEVDCLLTSSVHYGKDGSIAGYRGILRDLTKRKGLQKQLLHAQKMEAVGTLAGGVAHDFNNVLQVALGYSDLILADEDLPQRYRIDLQKIHESARRGAELVQRLLTFSRKTDLKRQPINLNYRVKDLRQMLERTIPKMIEIRLSLSENLGTINADPTQVDQILMNLAVNARDAMPEGGKLLIETNNVVLDEEYARTHLEAESGQYVLLTVTDTGTGMDKETLEHIFEPFFTTKGPGEGTGLGLATVYGIVKHHDGYITCYSETDCGTTFRLYFPAIDSDDQPIETAPRTLPRGGSETILLVDDEEFIRDFGSTILTKAGYKVIAASNGKEALEVYRTQIDEIDLVILDLVMPEMAGKQCLEGLLSLNSSLKVVIASGYSAKGPTKEALSTGAKGFVNKPYDIRQVLQVVRSVLDND